MENILKYLDAIKIRVVELSRLKFNGSVKIELSFKCGGCTGMKFSPIETVVL